MKSKPIVMSYNHTTLIEIVCVLVVFMHYGLVVLRWLYVLHEAVGYIATDRGNTDSFPSFSSHNEEN